MIARDVQQHIDEQPETARMPRAAFPRLRDRVVDKRNYRRQLRPELPGSPFVALFSEVYRREFRGLGWRWWVESSSGHVLGAEDPIPGPGIDRFDHALQGAYLRMAHAAVSVMGVSFCHGLESSSVATDSGSTVYSHVLR